MYSQGYVLPLVQGFPEQSNANRGIRRVFWKKRADFDPKGEEQASNDVKPKKPVSKRKINGY
jgi:hypothetical protein